VLILRDSRLDAQRLAELEGLLLSQPPVSLGWKRIVQVRCTQVPGERYARPAFVQPRRIVQEALRREQDDEVWLKPGNEHLD
jgi:hypothetical protein